MSGCFDVLKTDLATWYAPGFRVVGIKAANVANIVLAKA